MHLAPSSPARTAILQNPRIVLHPRVIRPRLHRLGESRILAVEALEQGAGRRNSGGETPWGHRAPAKGDERGGAADGLPPTRPERHQKKRNQSFGTPALMASHHRDSVAQVVERGSGMRSGAKEKSGALAKRSGSSLNLLLTIVGTGMILFFGIEAWCRLTSASPTLFQVLEAYGLMQGASLVYEPGKGFGQAMGYLGGTLLLLTLAYPIRKRLPRVLQVGRLQVWLDVHIFFGIVGTAMITLHTAGKLGGIVALSYLAMLVTFFSGVIGRFIYVQLPRRVQGRERDLQEFRSETVAELDRLSEELGAAGVLWQAPEWLDSKENGGLAADVGTFLSSGRQMRRRFRSLKGQLRGIPELEKSRRRRLERLAKAVLKKRRQSEAFRAARRLLSSWHRFHLPFTWLLFGVFALHVTVALLFYVGN